MLNDLMRKPRPLAIGRIIRITLALLVFGAIFHVSLVIAVMTGWYIPDGSPRLDGTAVWVLFVSLVFGLMAVLAYRLVAGRPALSYWLLAAFIVPLGQGISLAMTPPEILICDEPPVDPSPGTVVHCTSSTP
ncbi:hypothetical protein HS041_07150 [Planomonospora sp. ID67723]|uniref:hypothetical protein n=1 Tax=Planomonospora sp. ID67723 TaxID=2738134 RepID=UPI0018C36B77|nr:hypothetical protein [Planomonospora sp. ID67723]MBG0827538.1 hypothetical protein [Planomonospora sp. ID67723]